MIVQNPNPSLTSLDKEIFDKATRLINEMEKQPDFTKARRTLNLLLPRPTPEEAAVHLVIRNGLEPIFRERGQHDLWSAVNDLETDPRKPKITALLILGYYATHDPEKTLAFLRNTEYSKLCHEILSKLKLY